MKKIVIVCLLLISTCMLSSCTKKTFKEGIVYITKGDNQVATINLGYRKHDGFPRSSYITLKVKSDHIEIKGVYNYYTYNEKGEEILTETKKRTDKYYNVDYYIYVNGKIK